MSKRALLAGKDELSVAGDLHLLRERRHGQLRYVILLGAGVGSGAVLATFVAKASIGGTTPGSVWIGRSIP